MSYMFEIARRMVVLPLVFASLGSLAETSVSVTIRQPQMRWLFGGFGFQHSESMLTALMTEEFRDQRVLKTFHEIRPTFARAYTGFASCPKDRLDRFADYYDQTFRKAGTTLYTLPSTMPGGVASIDEKAYAAACVSNLSYVVRDRACRKVRYYCLSNELSTLDGWGWFMYQDKNRHYQRLSRALGEELRRNLPEVEMIGPDVSGGFDTQDKWMRTQISDLDSVTGAYVTHWYVYGRQPGDLALWNEYNKNFRNCVALAIDKHKRYVLGEFGFSPTKPVPGVMIDDRSVNTRAPHLAPKCAIALVEMAISAINCGTFAVAAWSFSDYPDPFIAEDGDTPLERARYDSTKSCYRPDVKYNKWGMFRWSDATRDYRSYPNLYTLGYLAKLFRKGSTVLPCEVTGEEQGVRASAVLNMDGSTSIALVNWGEAKDVSVVGEQVFQRPLRRYVYEAANVPYNDFNDLQPPSGLVAAGNGSFTVSLPADSVTYLTTDYRDREPTAVANIRREKGVLTWTPCADEEHRYYRIYRNGKQIASTVATSLAAEEEGRYEVASVDCWGNCRGAAE